MVCFTAMCIKMAEIYSKLCIEILEAIHRDIVMDSPTSDCEDIDTLHKTLLHWLVFYVLQPYI